MTAAPVDLRMPAVNERLTALAAGLLLEYRQRRGAIAGLVLGSISRGIADQDSDIDLEVIWRELPIAWIGDSVPLGGHGAYRDTWNPRDDAQAALEQYRLDGRKIDVGHSTMPAKRRLIEEVTVRCNLSPAGLLQVGGLLDARIVFDTGEVAALLETIPAYPDGLRAKVLEANAWLTPVASIRAALARGDLLAYYDMVVANLRRCIYRLAAVNGIYLGFVPDAKWSAWYLDRMPNRPSDHRRLLVESLGPASEAALDALETFMADTESITAGPAG